MGWRQIKLDELPYEVANPVRPALRAVYAQLNRPFHLCSFTDIGYHSSMPDAVWLNMWESVDDESGFWDYEYGFDWSPHPGYRMAFSLNSSNQKIKNKLCGDIYEPLARKDFEFVLNQFSEYIHGRQSVQPFEHPVVAAVDAAHSPLTQPSNSASGVKREAQDLSEFRVGSSDSYPGTNAAGIAGVPTPVKQEGQRKRRKQAAVSPSPTQPAGTPNLSAISAYASALLHEHTSAAATQPYSSTARSQPTSRVKSEVIVIDGGYTAVKQEPNTAIIKEEPITVIKQEDPVVKAEDVESFDCTECGELRELCPGPGCTMLRCRNIDCGAGYSKQFILCANEPCSCDAWYCCRHAYLLSRCC